MIREKPVESCGISQRDYVLTGLVKQLVYELQCHLGYLARLDAVSNDQAFRNLGPRGVFLRVPFGSFSAGGKFFLTPDSANSFGMSEFIRS